MDWWVSFFLWTETNFSACPCVTRTVLASHLILYPCVVWRYIVYIWEWKFETILTLSLLLRIRFRESHLYIKIWMVNGWSSGEATDRLGWSHGWELSEGDCFRRHARGVRLWKFLCTNTNKLMQHGGPDGTCQSLVCYPSLLMVLPVQLYLRLFPIQEWFLFLYQSQLSVNMG